VGCGISDVGLSGCVARSLVKFLGAFTKLQKTAISFVMSVCMEQLGSHWTGLS